MRKSSRLVVLLLSLAASSLTSGIARAADPNVPRIGPEEGPRAKLERALKGLSAEDAKAARELAGKDPRDAVHALLVAKNPAYAAAVATFDKDGANAEDFQKLIAGIDRKAPLAAALEAHATYFLGRCYLNRDEFDKACEAFENVRTRDRDATAWTDEATLHLGYAYARRPELDEEKERLWKTRATQCLEALAPESGAPVYANAPERTRESAAWLLKELKGEGSGPLLELARRMETIQGQIDHERTGKPTQKKQEQVISEIDRLIALMREKEQGGDGQGGGGGQKGQGGKGGQKASGPARKSSLPGALQPGEIAKTRPGATQEWGNLTEKEREQAIQALNDGKFPERYKELAEQYFKEIAKQAGPIKKDDRPKPPAPPEKKDK